MRGRWLNTLNPILESTFLKGKRKINWRSESCGLSKVEVLLIDESVESRKSAVKPNKKTLKKLPALLRLRTFPTFEGKYATRFSMSNSLSRFLHTYFYNRVTAFCATGAREGPIVQQRYESALHLQYLIIWCPYISLYLQLAVETFRIIYISLKWQVAIVTIRYSDNSPHYNSAKWHCTTIHFDTHRSPWIFFFFSYRGIFVKIFVSFARTKMDLTDIKCIVTKCDLSEL